MALAAEATGPSAEVGAVAADAAIKPGQAKLPPDDEVVVVVAATEA